MGDSPGKRRRAEALSRWLEDGGREALDFVTLRAMDVVGVVDQDLIVRYVNWTAPGLTREGVVGMNVVDLAPPEYQDKARSIYRGVLATGQGSQFEIMYRDDEQVLMWEVRVGPICVDGEVIGLVTISADVTEQRRAQADRDRFFLLSLDLLVVAARDGRFRRVSPSFAQTFGYSEAELCERPFIDFVHPDDRVQTLQAFEGLLGGTPVIDFENRYRGSDGEYRVLSWRSNIDPVTGDLYGVARDITQHRATELQLRQAQKMEAVGQLAGGVAHDFNNLMLAILANAELALTDDPPPSSTLVQRLADIQGAAHRAADLTKQLLAFSHRQPLRPVPVDLNSLVNGLMAMLRRLIPEHIGIDMVLAQPLSTVSADPTQMEQVLVNLCVNARDAMEGGGQLTISTEDVVIHGQQSAAIRPGRYVLLRVADTGTGMTDEVRERMFEPFFSTKANHGGSGLGLATVYGIVQQHNGVIHVDTELGRGTTFKVYLPVHDQLMVQAGAEPPGVSLRGEETILVAEDEGTVRSAMVEMLERAGYRTLVAADGLDAVKLLGERPEAIDLVILDVVMPGLGGPETWERLQGLRTGLKVLFCSGYADDRYLKRLPPGAEVLEKPFRAEQILARVRALLDR